MGSEQPYGKGEVSTEAREAYQTYRHAGRARERNEDAEERFNALPEVKGIDDLLSVFGNTQEFDFGANDAQGFEREIQAVQEEARTQLEPEVFEAAQRDAWKRLRTFMRFYYTMLGPKIERAGDETDQTGGKKPRRVKVELEEMVKKLISSAHADPMLREQPITWQRIRTYEEQIARIESVVEQEAFKSPETFFAYGLLRLRAYKQQYEEAGIVETPAIQKLHAQVGEDTRKHLEGTNGVVVLVGPTGSGKTVLARKMASELSPDGEYEFISAHNKMVPEDIIQRFGLTVEKSIAPENIEDVANESFVRFRSDHPDITDTAELARIKEDIHSAVVALAGQRILTTEEILMAVGRAREKGCKVIIDEFNYLPPETVAALNDILSNQRGGETGFGIIMTGNIGDEYKSRKDLDPAFVNRVMSNIVTCPYPPQEHEKPLHESIIKTDAYQSGQQPPERNLYLAGITQLLDEKGNLLAPRNANEDVWNLSRAFSLIQQVATGKQPRELLQGDEGFQEVTAMKFEKVFLSFRNFNEILRSWKLDGYTGTLDDFVYDKLIRPARIIAPREAAQLYYLFKFEGFFTDSRYNSVDVTSTNWTLKGEPSIPASPEKTSEISYVSTKDLIENAFGVETPPYQDDTVPGGTHEKGRSETMEFAMEMEKRKEESERVLKEIDDDMERLCGDINTLLEEAKTKIAEAQTAHEQEMARREAQAQL